MADKKKILKHCTNFDEIINCDFLEDDILTSIDKEIEELTIRRKYLFEIIKKENNYNIF